MSFGAIYRVSWFGNTNETNGWGFSYPFDADQSTLSADTLKVTADNNSITADATVF